MAEISVLSVYYDTADGGVKVRKPDNTTMTVGSPSSGEANTASNVGSGAGKVYKEKSGVDLRLKSIAAGTGMSVTNGTDDVTIACTVSAGETNTVSNLGSGAQVAGTKSGVNFPFRSFIGSAPIVVSQNTNDITISVSNIANAQISTSAAIASSKLSPPGSSGQPIINSSGAFAGASNWSMGTGLTGSTGSFVSVASYFSTGAAPATTGQYRLTGSASSSLIFVRYSGTDYSFLSQDASGHYLVGSTSLNCTLSGYATMLNATTGPTIIVGAGTETFRSDGGYNLLTRMMVGNTSSNSPWSVHGDKSITMANANKTLTVDEYTRQFWRFTGSLGGNRVVTIPSIAGGEAYSKDAWVDINENSTLTLSTGSGKTVALRGSASTDNITRARITVTSAGVVVDSCVTVAQANSMGN
ncbi:MAG: hypothetical protein KF795_00620 [Labilithrix sp.]|nr:hypothetical protein [Labilithrix sp.]